MYGYAVAEAYNKIAQPHEPRDSVWIGNRDAYRGAIFFFLVALTGHAVRAIFY